MRAQFVGPFAITILLALNTGCGWFGPAQPSGGVAVVDLDVIAEQVGADAEIAQALKAREVQLNSQLKTIKTNYLQQFEQRKTLYGESPSDAQSKQLVTIGQQINLNLANAQRQAAGQLTNHRSELVMKFRKRVGPVAQQIAKERGLSIVVPKNDGWLLAVDDTVNITDEVATSLKDDWKPISLTAEGSPQPPQVVTQPSQAPGDTSGQGVQPASHEEPAPSTP